MTLSLLACLSTLLSLALLDGLSWDLEAAARTRLDGAATAAERLLANSLEDTLTRWQALSRTPEFRANLEVANRSTLRYFARELSTAERASLVAFEDRNRKPIAMAGDAALEEAARKVVASQVDARVQTDAAICVGPQARSRRRADAARVEFQPCPKTMREPTATLFAHDNAGYALIRVPLLTGGRVLGFLTVSEQLPDDLLADWSTIIGATLTVDARSESVTGFTADVLRLNGLVARVWTSNESEREALVASRWRMLAAGAFALSVGLMVAVWLGSTLARPIQALRDATVRAGRGDLDVRVDAARYDELGEVARAFNSTLENLRVSRDRLYHMAYHDPLTEVGNRRSFQDELARRLQPGADASSPLALMLIDLTRFKTVNDTLGNLAGDQVLKEASTRIEKSVGEFAEDSRMGPWRIGGNEFTILLTGDDPEQTAQRIIDSFRSPFAVSEQEIAIGVRIGIVPDLRGFRSTSEAMRSCDLALRDAKRRGGNCYIVYDHSMAEPVLRRHAMETRLREAVDAGALAVVYQPRVAAASGRINGFEALVRWNDAVFGAVAPEEFVRLAEDTRIIVPMGERVLRSAVVQLARWREQLPSQPVRVSVNVSPVQLTASFMELVKEILAQHQVEPSRLELEITETALMQDEGHAVEVLAALRTLGVRIALDDFGSGYSSLAVLRQLPIGVLKMDRAFVRSLGEDADAEAIAAAIVALARIYGMEVVAEGVETSEQRDLLAQLGCDELQGYLFAPPLAVEDATRALERRTLQGRKRDRALRS